MPTELFKVEVNEEGAQVFRRLSKLSVIILIATLLLGSLQVMGVLHLLLKSVNFSTGVKRMSHPLYLSVASVVLGFFMQAVQIILYRRFVKLAANSIRGSDSGGFNRAFRLLYLQAVWYLMQLGVNFLFMTADFLLYV